MPLSLATIRFATSGRGEAQDEFLTGVLAPHSFRYPEARRRFRKARELDRQLQARSVDWTDREMEHIEAYHAFEWLFDARLALEENDEARDQLAELERMRSMARSRGEKLDDIGRLLFDFRRRRLRRVCDTGATPQGSESADCS